MKYIVFLLLVCSPLTAQQLVNGHRVNAGTINHCPGTSGTDTYACSMEANIPAYMDGLRVQFKADVANIGAATLNINGLGDIPIVKAAGAALDDNDIRITDPVDLVYVSPGDFFRMQSLLGNASGGGGAGSMTAITNSPFGTIPLSATRYSADAVAWQTTAAAIRFRFPATGTLSNLYVETSNTQSATGSVVCTVQVADDDTDMVATITAGASAGSFTDLTNTAVISSGDYLALKCVNNATATSASILTWTVRFQSSAGGGGTSVSTIHNSPFGVVAASSTRHSADGIGWQSAPTSVRMKLPVTGTLSHLYVETTTTQSATGSMVCTVAVASVDTAITTTIAAGEVAGSFTDLVNTAAVTSGDYLHLKCVNNATASSAIVATWSLRFQP